MGMPRVDTAKLTELQLTGHNCVICNANFDANVIPQFPMGMGPMREVMFACLLHMDYRS